MANVTNNTSNAMLIAGVLIAAGETGAVPDYESVKDSFPIKAFLKAKAISVEADKADAKAKA